MSREDWLRHAIGRNPALEAEQQQYEHNALMNRARLHEQMALEGIEPPDPHETIHQQNVVAWAKAEGLLVIAIPNGAHLQGDEAQRVRQYRRLEREGLWPGCPDLVFPGTTIDRKSVLLIREDIAHMNDDALLATLNRCLRRTLWIEMKRLKHGKPSEDQIKAHKRLRELGDRVEICNGEDAAKSVVRDHFGFE